ncbi:MerR family transcriptional regulator [Sediminivirga luteola]|uniref:MerR family transcriptional regulator n=1 Tax=Sediminivirga luteola TaxID=1774748 RepID=A0A8J2XM67_9MICO|nr:MerR family transcriptional regulator [Sediminivirga luteola]GGA29228.1 MerR family transcriptional regulator [Sediminivirga luteola]
MLIGDLAARTGVSPRSLRHCEAQHLLDPMRDSSGYRHYQEADVTRVLQIIAMMDGGMNTDTIWRFLDCARTLDEGIVLEMCPDLRAEVEAIGERLVADQQKLTATRQHLTTLTGTGR